MAVPKRFKKNKTKVSYKKLHNNQTSIKSYQNKYLFKYLFWFEIYNM